MFEHSSSHCLLLSLVHISPGITCVFDLLAVFSTIIDCLCHSMALSMRAPTVPTLPPPMEPPAAPQQLGFDAADDDDLFGDAAELFDCSLLDDDFELLLDASGIAPSEAETCADALPDGASSVTGASSTADGCADKLCVVCEVAVIVPRTLFCLSCSPDARACRKDARKSKQGQETWKAAQKVPKQMWELVLAYRGKCRAQGRGAARPPFDWLKYGQEQRASSEINTGEKKIWMSTHKYFTLCREWDGPMQTDSELQDKWDELIESLLDSQLSAYHTYALVPAYTYVDGFNNRAHVEKLEVGHREKKHPSIVGVTSRFGWLGHDQLDWNDLGKDLTGTCRHLLGEQVCKEECCPNGRSKPCWS